MSDVYAEAQRLAGSTEDELYEEIGRIVSPKMAFPPRMPELISNGRQWFSQQRTQLCEIVCADRRVRPLTKLDRATHEAIAAVCGPLDVAVHLPQGVPAVTVSAVIVRVGIHHFCAD